VGACLNHAKVRFTCPVFIGFIGMAISRSRKTLNELLLRAKLGQNRQRPLTKTLEIGEYFMSSPYQPYPQEPPGGYGQPPYPPQDGWDSSQRGYLQGGPVGFGEAVSEGFKHLTNFNGRASRSAFWWFFLGAIIIDLVGGIIGRTAHAVVIQYIVTVIVALVSLSLAVRRLHDSGKSGFWWLIGLIPIIGTIVLLVFYCMPGTPGPNKYDS
jgi:uncharacterized membrane protein YhaH (DUF805 family)